MDGKTNSLNVSVVGYPACAPQENEKHRKGFMYEHSGNLLNVSETELGGWIIYYDVDTTSGQSGSPIHLITK